MFDNARFDFTVSAQPYSIVVFKMGLVLKIISFMITYRVFFGGGVGFSFRLKEKQNNRE